MKKIYFFLIALFVSLTMNAGEVTEQQALQKAQQFMKGKQFKQKNLRRAASTAGNAYYVFNAESNGGFVVVAGDDRMPDILGYSEKGNFNTTKIPTNVKWLMDYYAKIAQSLKVSKNTKTTRRAAAERTEVLPLMKTAWDQGAPYNQNCPEIEGNKALTGCVATAMAQVINFLQWPLSETKAIAEYKTTQDQVDVPALPAKKFNWYNMTDEEIAWLMRYCGQSVMMEYKADESGAAPSNIPYALISYFGFSKSTMIVDHTSYSDSDWEEMIYNEVNLGRPVIYSGFQSGGGSGHSFVVHGYRDGKFLVNWGWSGNCDGYFTLTNLAPNEYMDFSSDQNAVVGIQPASADVIVDEGVRTIDVKKAGTLSDYISETEKYTIKDLTLTGEINGTDLRLIREMIGCNDLNSKGQLYYLDLSGVRIVKGGEPYNLNYYTSDNELGESVFQNCFKLASLILPNSLEIIKKDAMGGGYNLRKVVIPKSVTQIELPVFSACNLLSSIVIDEDNPVYTTMGNSNAIIERATNKLIAACPSTSIPEGVTTIASNAFSSLYYQMGSFKFPESLTTIEDYAFGGSAIETFSIPKNVNNISPMAFSLGLDTYPYSIIVDPLNTIYDSRDNCNAIIETATNKLVAGCSNSTIPEGVTTIGESAFMNQDLTHIEIPYSVTNIQEGAFSLSKLHSVKVTRQDPIEVAEYAFWVPDNAQLIVPDGSKAKYEIALGWKNFKNIVEESEYASQRLTLNVTTAGSLSTLIPEEDKYTIEELVIKGELNGSDLLLLHDMTGYYNGNSTEGRLRYLDISDAIIVAGGETNVSKANTLGQDAFFNCKLEEIILPRTLTSIENSAFGSSKIRSIIIPKSVTELGRDVFYYCPLYSISVEEGNPVFDSRDNCNAVIETATNTLRIGCPKTVIPNDVKTIGVTAFSGKPGLTSVDLPDGVTTIEWAAYWSNIALTSVHISKSVLNFGESPFGACNRITSFIVDSENPVYDSRNNCNALIETATNTLVQGFASSTIPDGVKTIAQSAFQSQDYLTSIEIPASVTSIGRNAFYGCSSLTKIISHIKKPYSLGGMAFDGDNVPIATLYVPYGTKAVYASTPGWDVFGNIIEMEPDDSYQSNSASISKVEFGKHYAALNGEVEIPITVSGEGIVPITSIDYTINNSTEQHLEVEPISYMMTSEVLIPFKADATTGEVVKTLKITKVNGVANECTENVSATGTLVTVAKKPKIIPVLEEYTGTWCGWCARGIVGLNLLNKTFKNDVITIAIHDGGDNEPMMLPEYRSTSGNYPSCQINRGELMDPYFGSSNSIFGIKRDVEAAQRVYALGGIEVNAEWTDDTKTAIDITTTTTFVEDVASSPYQIGYVLLEDGLAGTGDGWAQSNYYAGSNTIDENLKELTNKPAKITDMKYDHVPVAAWEPMTGVAGTIPTTITHDVPMEYTFKADISGNTRIQNKNKLTVVVLLIDKETGKIINANKVSMSSDMERSVEFATGQKWQTFYSEEACRPVEGSNAKVYAVTGINEQTVYVEEITDGVPANLMVLIGLDNKATESTTVNFEKCSASYSGTNLLKGNNVETTGLTTYSTYVLYKDEFVLNSGSTVAAGKGYLLADDMRPANSARSLDIVIGDGTTIIREAISGEYLKDVWFDLQGRRYEGKPSKQGVYIINNKKVVIK